jgi:hypothetical protein
MEALAPFETTLTLCFTPEHLGMERHYTSPPRNGEDFAEFVSWAVGRYAPQNNVSTASRHSERTKVGAEN